MKITMVTVGERVAALRRRKGYSQQELSEQIQISRPSLVQIESGRRKVDVLELKRLSQILEFSMDDFMSGDFNVNEATGSPWTVKPLKQAERPSRPTFILSTFKNVLLYLLGRCAGKPNLGASALNKLLYFADFNHYELYEEHLTGCVYKKLDFGPVPVQLSAMIDELTVKKQILRVKTTYHDEPQIRYLALIKPDLTQMKASEKEVIDQVVELMGDWSDHAITRYAHEDMPWVATREGEVIDYELAFYRTQPYSVRKYDDQEEG